MYDGISGSVIKERSGKQRSPGPDIFKLVVMMGVGMVMVMVVVMVVVMIVAVAMAMTIMAMIMMMVMVLRFVVVAMLDRRGVGRIFCVRPGSEYTLPPSRNLSCPSLKGVQ